MLCYLSCNNIHLKAGYKDLISSFSMSLYPSQSIAIQGTNGCGKTSLLRVLAGISRPYAGSVTLLNNKILQQMHKIQILYLTSVPSLYLDLPVIWNLEFYTQSYAYSFSTKEYLQALEKVGLENKANQVARTLSTGQQRRLSLAVLSLLKPQILIADEPTNGLDSEGFSLCIEYLETLKLNNSAIIVATHEEKLANWCGQKINLENYLPINKPKNKLVKELL